MTANSFPKWVKTEKNAIADLSRLAREFPMFLLLGRIFSDRKEFEAWAVRLGTIFPQGPMREMSVEFSENGIPLSSRTRLDWHIDGRYLAAPPQFG